MKPGEKETLTMEIKILASFNTKQSAWIVDSGLYTFKVGASSRDIKGVATAKIKGQKQPVNNVLKPQEQLNLLVGKK